MLSRIRNSLYNIMVLGLTLGAVILLLLTLLLPRSEKQAAVPVQSETSAAQYLARTSGSRVVISRTGRSEPVMVTESMGRRCINFASSILETPDAAARRAAARSGRAGRRHSDLSNSIPTRNCCCGSDDRLGTLLSN